MPFLVKHLIEGKPVPMTIKQDDTVIEALKLMAKHDFSQLPVVNQEDYPLGMVTYESILRGVRSFKAHLEDLHVRDVIVAAPTFGMEDDLFDLLTQLKMTNAVLIIESGIDLVGIVTSYDSTEYFRSHAEHLMRVEDIETTIKEINLLAYTRADGTTDEARLAEIISKTANNESASNKVKTYDDLNLTQYISILLNTKTWPVFESIFQISRDALRNILYDIRDTRNDLAHFRSEIMPEQAEQLRFCADWLTGHWESYQKIKQDEMFRQLLESNRQPKPVATAEEQIGDQATVAATEARVPESGGLEKIPVIAEVSAPGESRYTPLADWLSSQPGEVDQVTLSFNEIEAIIDGNLPDSARTHRAWWANVTQTHPQSKAWLEVSWGRSYLNMSEERVVFVRIRERNRAYIDFFGKLLKETKKTDFPLRDVSPDGSSWIACKTISTPGYAVASFTFSFTRGQRFRIELYLDTYDQGTTKQVFDRIQAERTTIEASLGTLSWERIDDKRASRIALYHPGAITDGDEKLAELRVWAVDKMAAFYKTLEPIASLAIQEVLQP